MSKLLLTTNGRLFRIPNGDFYTPIVYGYDFFLRYLKIFDSVRLVAHVKDVDQEYVRGMLKVNGPYVDIFPVSFPKGKIGYLLSYRSIKKELKQSFDGCTAAILRIPDELAFQVFKTLKTHSNIPVGIEVTSNSWDFFSPGSMKSIFRPLLRRWWDYNQQAICKEAEASCYVTKEAIQRRYPVAPNSFSTYCSDVDIEHYSSDKPRDYGKTPLKKIKVLHVSGSITGRAKGHKELIESIAILTKKGYDVQCTLVGGGVLDKDIADVITLNSLKINCTGKKNAAEIRELLLTNDMFVFPSYREGLPRVIVEAMASGIFIIATKLDGIRELLPGECLVEVRDSASLADKIVHFLNNPNKMSAISAINKDTSKDYTTEALNKRRNSFYQYVKSLEK